MMNTIDDLLGTDLEPFSGCFELIRRKTPFTEAYKVVIETTERDLNRVGSPQLGLQPRLLPSSRIRSSSNGRAPMDIFDRPLSSRAHMWFPHSPICCPLYGIYAQAVLGVDYEGMGLSREQLILVLQQVACGRQGEDRKSGLRYSPYNLVRLCTNHEPFIDTQPLVLLLPIFEDLERVKDWVPGQSYWVMVLIGTHRDAPAGFTDSFLQTSITRYGPGELLSHGVREWCTPNDIRSAVALLKHYVKALADVANGRPDKLSMVDLVNPGSPIAEMQPRIDAMAATRQKYLDNRCRESNAEWGPPRVTVPEIKPGNNFRVLKIHLNASTTDGVVPDPSSLLGKTGINWSFRCGEKPVSACGDGPSDEEMEEEEIYERARDETIRASFIPPTELAMDLQQDHNGSRRVTLSPPEKMAKSRSSFGWENLDDDDDDDDA